MKKRFLYILTIFILIFTVACSGSKNEKTIILKMQGLKTETYTKDEFYHFLKENEEPILEFLDAINDKFEFKNNELYLDNKKVASLTIDFADQKDFEKTFYYSNLNADNDKDLVIDILIDGKDGMNSKITEKNLGQLKKENEKINKEFVEAGMTEKDGHLYFNNKPVNSIIEEDSSGKASIFYVRSDGIQVKVTRNADGKITNMSEVK